VIESLAPNIGRVVCISSPKFTRGFNGIEVEYSKVGMPIGCTVWNYRVKPDGRVEAELGGRIPLLRPPIGGAFLDAETLRLVNKLPLNKALRFASIRRIANDGRKRIVADERLANLLLEAEWSSLVSLSDKDNGVGFLRRYTEFKFWKVKREA
jgi:hypothetical protein